jgi:CubicO group peptidase (beta-lactamase class C family)
MQIHFSKLGPDFEKIVEQAIQTYQPVADTGVAVAVLRNGQLSYAGGFGFRDRATRAAVDADTCFAIGSATKAFTSMALSIFEQQGTISLDAPITQFLPVFKMADPQAARDTTLIDILCHRTGLAPHNCLWYLGPFTRAQLFYRLRYLEPAAAFRATYIYNNVMYMVAGHLLEALLGLSYEEIIQTHILSPLGMTATNPSFTALTGSQNHALGYELADELALKDFTNIGPAAEINSTALDMAKWVGLFLRKGLTGNGSVVLGQALLERMYQPFTDPGDGTKYGLGWNIGAARLAAPGGPQEKRLIFHTGDPVGGSAYVSFMPDDGLGVVVLTNQHCTDKLINKWPDRVATDIYDHLLHDKLSGQLTLPTCSPDGRLSLPTAPPPPVTGLTAQAAPAAAAPAPPAAIGDYTGMFSNPGYGDFVVSSAGNHLQISYYESSWELTQLSELQFLFKVQAFGTEFPVVVMFSKNGSGAVMAFSASLVLKPRVLMIPFAKR